MKVSIEGADTGSNRAAILYKHYDILCVCVVDVLCRLVGGWKVGCFEATDELFPPDTRARGWSGWSDSGA